VISQTEDRVLYRLVEISLGWLAVGAGRGSLVRCEQHDSLYIRKGLPKKTKERNRLLWWIGMKADSSNF